MDDERVYLNTDEAIRMLPDGDMIHTYRQGGGLVLIGADLERERLVEKIKSGKPELAGENATRSGHGLAIVDEYGLLYIETKRQTEEQRLAAELAALRAELEQARADTQKVAHALLAPYTRVLKEDAEVGGFAISILEFPGCYSEGETREEAMSNIEEAAIAWMLAALGQGQTIPEPRKYVAELEQARAERDAVTKEREEARLIADSWRGIANINEVLLASANHDDERSRETIRRLVVACRAAAKVMRDNKDVLWRDLIWEWSGNIFEHYNPELFEDEDIEKTSARLRAAGYDVEAFEARIREVINQARVKRDEQQAKQAGEA
jgi:predicted RNase H-like HicB family nuclease